MGTGRPFVVVCRHQPNQTKQPPVRFVAITQVVQAVGGIDLLIGGPPCQAYSMAGKRDFDDPRGQLFEDYVSVAREFCPAIVIMENVKGILSMRHLRSGIDPELTDAYRAATSRERRAKRFDALTEYVTDKIVARLRDVVTT